MSHPSAMSGTAEGRAAASATGPASDDRVYTVTLSLRFGRKPLAYLGLGLVGLAWASNFLLAPLALRELSPATVAFFRWGLAVLFVLPLAWPAIAADLPVDRRGFRHLLACALLGFGGFATLSYDAVVTGARIDAMLLLAGAPLVALVLARLLVRETQPPLVWIGIVVGFLGVAFAATRGGLDLVAPSASRPSSLSMVVAVVCFAAYVVALRNRPGLRPLTVFALTALLAALGLFPIMLFDLGVRPIAWPSTTTVLVLVFLALVPSIGGFLLFTWVAGVLGGARASQVLHLVPVFGALGSVLIFGEALQGHHVVAAVLVGIGLVLAFGARLKGG